MTPIFATLFIAAVIISTSLFVILIGHFQQHKRKEKMLRVFEKLSAEFGLSVSKQDVFGERIIGLDEVNRNLLFVTKKGDGHIVDLDDLKTVTIKKEYGLVFDGHSRRKDAKASVKRIKVELIYRNSAVPVSLSLYDEENSDHIKRDQAVEMADNWQKLISGILMKQGNVRVNKKGLRSYSTLFETMNELRKVGYTEDFNLQQNRLEVPNSNIQLFPHEFKVDRYFRFEGESNPSDASILYAVSSDRSNLKGLLVNAYGIYSEQETDELLEAMEMRK